MKAIAATNQHLVKGLLSKGVLITPRIIEAFQKIDRKNFIPSENIEYAYEDRALPIISGQTISQPSTVAFMFELLQPNLGDKILDVGTGSAYTTALLSFLAGEKGHVTGVEILKELIEFSQKNMAKTGIRNYEIHLAEKELGFKPKAPYDKILVSAFSNEIPQELVDQLNPLGTLVMPIKNAIVKITKDKLGFIETQEFKGYVFVPLVDLKHQNNLKFIEESLV